MFRSLKSCWARANFTWVHIRGFLQMIVTRNGVLLILLKRAREMKTCLERCLSWFGITSQTRKMIRLKILITTATTLFPPTSTYPLSLSLSCKLYSQSFLYSSSSSSFFWVGGAILKIWYVSFPLVVQKWWRKWWNSGVATNKVQEEEA